MKRVVLLRKMRGVILKDDAAWEKMHAALQDAMTRAWDKSMRDAIVAGLDVMRELPPGKFSQDDADLIMRQMEGKVGADAIQAAMRGPVLNLTNALYRIGGQEVTRPAGVDLKFGRPDLKALDLVGRANLFRVANSWNSHTDKLLRGGLEAYFKEGLTRDRLAERFAKDFAGHGERGHVYWNLMADHAA
ncbi:MAG: hypothetical protein GY862_03345 [Gammaproteobacteria bacterium]|nr:hypothetical protein [Gammaproteobacteria bacterium]